MSRARGGYLIRNSTYGRLSLMIGLYRRLRTSLTADINTSTKIKVAEPTHKNVPVASQPNPASAQELEVSQSHASLIRRPMYLDNNPAPTKAADMYNVILICNQYILVASPPLPDTSLLPSMSGMVT